MGHFDASMLATDPSTTARDRLPNKKPQEAQDTHALCLLCLLWVLSSLVKVSVLGCAPQRSEALDEWTG